MKSSVLVTIATLTASALSAAPAAMGPLPRTPDGRPNFEGIWQASSTAAADLEDHVARLNMLAGRSVVSTADGATQIPYQPWAAAKKQANFAARQKDDPLSQCYLPGTPRMMYMEYPLQIFQTQRAVAITFEWSLVFRLIPTDAGPHPDVIGTWMGDARGRWEGDTLVVDVVDFNEDTWFDRAGNFHSDELHLVERFTALDRDHITYEVTVEDSKVFARPWRMSMILYRHREPNLQLLEYDCFGFDNAFHPPVPQSQ
jgi:hypothetical protein